MPVPQVTEASAGQGTAASGHPPEYVALRSSLWTAGRAKLCEFTNDVNSGIRMKS
jgi:hypothetical protein